MYISALTFATASYLLRKHGKTETRLLLDNLRKLSKITTIGEKEIDDALASTFDDYEDALQYFSALHQKVEAIITRNKKNFKASKIPVMTPTEFLNL